MAGRILWGAGTSRTLRVVWMLHELGLDYEHRRIGSRTGETQSSEFRAINPREKIPAFEEGGLVLAESAAIMTYLVETHRPDSTLLPPPGTPDRALHRQWCYFIMTELDAHSLYVLRRHRPPPLGLSNLYGEAPVATRSAEAYFEKQVAVAADQIERTGRHLLGDVFTVADMLLTTCVDWAERYEVPVPGVLHAYAARIHERPAYRSALAAN